MKKLFLSAIATVLSAVAITAQDAVSITNFSIEPGETKQFSIELSNSKEYTAFQMDLMLPEGLSIATTINEDEETVKDITLDSSRKKSSHTIAFNTLSSGATRIVSYSSSNAVFKGTSGALVNLSVTAASDMAAGNYEIKLNNVAFTEPDGTEYSFADVTAVMSINSVDDEKYSAIINCSENGAAMLSANEVAGGSPLTLFIAPYDGYKVSSLLVNDVAVEVRNNVYSIASVQEDIVFKVSFEELLPDTIEIEKIVTDTIEIEKIITDTIEIEKIVTDTIEIEKIVTDTVYIAEVDEIPVPEFSYSDGMLTISCALQNAKIYYTLDGSVPTTGSDEYVSPIEVSTNCTVTAIAVLSSECASDTLSGTNIKDISDEVVSCRYFTENGVEIDEPRTGINIVVMEYAGGRTETKKIMVRKK